MIRDVGGTIFITVEAFRDRYHWAAFGAPFTYATGNLAQACEIDQDARDLRQLVYQLQNDHKLELARASIGRGRFEYFATRLAKGRSDMRTAPSAASAPSIGAPTPEQVQKPAHGRKKPTVPCE